MSRKTRKHRKKADQSPKPAARNTKNWLIVGAVALLFVIAFLAYRYTLKRSELHAVHTYAGSIDLHQMEPQVAEKINRLRKELEQNPGSAEAWGKLAMNLHVHDLEKQAVPLYQQAASLDPSNFRWPYLCALLLSESGSADSLQWLERARKIQPDYVPLLIHYGDALFQSGKIAEAEEQYRAALSFDPVSSNACMGLARIELQRGKVEESRAYLQKALQNNPTYSEAYHLLASVERRLGNPEGANKALHMAEGLPEKTPFNDPVFSDLTAEGESALWYSFRGWEYLKKGEYDAAIRELETAHKMHPNAQTHEDLGAAYASAGKLQQAMEHYTIAVQIHPTHLNYHNLALIYARLGRGQDSEAMFKKALELKPDYAEAYFNLGVLYAKAGRLEDTIATLKHAIHFNPAYPNARYHLGLAYLAKADRDSAMEQYKALLTLDQKTAERLFTAIHQSTAKTP